MIKSTEKPLGFTTFGHVANQIHLLHNRSMIRNIEKNLTKYANKQKFKCLNLLFKTTKTIPMLTVAAILSY